jgi:hypothetical protein
VHKRELVDSTAALRMEEVAVEMTQLPLPGGVPITRIAYTDPDTGETTEVTLDSAVFVVLLQVLRTWGRERALALLTFSAGLVQPHLSTVDHQRLDYTLTAVERYVAQWDDPTELALAISYEQLRLGQLTDQQTATFASTVLDRRVTPVAWRKRVDRWARRQGLPALGDAPPDAGA